MDIIKKYKELFIIGLIILGLAFYWYEYRPSQIKKECFNKARDFRIEVNNKDISISFEDLNKRYDFIYKNCLRAEGL
ncbi:MAG: hypothetical protein WCZ99_02570 [Candidatus Paceibacterota bacterium]